MPKNQIVEIPAFVQVSAAIAGAKEYFEGNIGNVFSEEVVEGRMAISRDDTGFTIALDYDSDHEEATGEIGISASWDSLEEAEEAFWGVYRDHWEGQINEDSKIFKFVTEGESPAIESLLEEKPLFLSELKSALGDFSETHNGNATLQDFVSYLLNSGTVEIDFENLNNEALAKVAENSISVLTNQLNRKGRGN